MNINGVDPGSYVPLVVAPDAGNKVLSADIKIVAQSITNQTKHLDNVVTDGTYAITCGSVVASSVTGSAGAVAGVTGTGAGTGDGGVFTGASTGDGVKCVGGTAGGTAGRFTGGGTTGTGIIATGGSTNGSGIVATGIGASGRGGSFSANAASLAILCGTGNMGFTGAQPVATDDPGFNNYACGTNMPKSWALVDLSSGTITLTDGYNTASLAFNGSYIRVTFARAITNPVVHATLSTVAVPQFSVVSSTVVQIGMFEVVAGSFSQINLSATTATLGVTVFGRQ